MAKKWKYIKYKVCRDAITGRVITVKEAQRRKKTAIGRSGLLQKEDDSVYAPKMTVDNITRTFSPSPEKS